MKVIKQITLPCYDGHERTKIPDHYHVISAVYAFDGQRSWWELVVEVPESLDSTP